jgi:hypothetical protein
MAGVYEEDAATLPVPLRAELAPLRTLEHVLAWMGRRGIPLTAIDVVTQDEFTHDASVPLGDGRWIAFGVT